MSRLELLDLRPHVGRAVSIGVGEGESLAIGGPSGSGKTLLLRAIADLDPHTGEVLLDGEPQTRRSGPEWRRRVGYLPAESHWWVPMVGDHFRAGEADLRAELDALQLPAGCFGWEIERLSSGERQRLALLRMLDRGPRVLLLDEPTANLDPESGRAVEEIVRAYRERNAAPVVWVSHRQDQRARVAGTELLLDRNGDDVDGS